MLDIMTTAQDNTQQNVAFFLGYGWLGISTPPLMCALHLAEQGWHVDVYAKYDKHCDDMHLCQPAITHQHITFIYDNTPPRDQSLACLGNGWHIPEAQTNSVRLARESAKKYAWVVGFDPEGLIQAAAFAGPLRIPYIYHSLEITQASPLKAAEKYCHRHALLSITQDAARADILAQLNHVDRQNIFYLPNSSTGAVLSQKDRYFNTLFPDIGERHIIMVCGTLLPECCIDDILLASETWAENVVLVLHGWIPEPNFKARVETYVQQRENVFLSSELLSPAEKFRIFQSADVCLIFYASTTDNLKYAAGASGKLYDAMRCGTPMIGNDVPGMSALLQDTGCGMVVPDAKAIAIALPVLLKHGALFRKNCFATYPQYEFSAAYTQILRTIAERIAL